MQNFAATHIEFQVLKVCKGRVWRGSVPTLELYGVTRTGESLTLIVPGFRPYFYLGLVDSTVPDLDHFKETLNGLVSQHAAQAALSRGWSYEPRDHVIDVTLTEPRYDLADAFEPRPFLRISFATPSDAFTALKCFPHPSLGPYYQLYESHVPYDLRYMIDVGLSGASWAIVPNSHLRPAHGLNAYTERTWIVNTPDSITPHPQPPATNAPMRVLAFDLECLGLKAEHHPIIQISAVECTFDGRVLHQRLFCVGTCDPITDVDVRSFVREKDMLEAFSLYLRAYDPQVITGYNIRAFDLPFVIDRMRLLEIPDGLRALGVTPGVVTSYETRKFESAARGTRYVNTIPLPGRSIIDAMELIMRENNLRSYTLNHVSEVFLKAHKDDVHYTLIPKLQAGSSADRARLGRYCVKDSLLVAQLIAAKKLVINDLALSAVTGVQLEEVMARGQQFRVSALIVRRGELAGRRTLMPSRSHTDDALKLLDPLGEGIEGGEGEDEGESDDEPDPDAPPSTASVSSTGKGYQGATVLSPLIGFYTEPVATLDFASLYPSIMMAHNLCYSSIVTPAQSALLGEGVAVRAGNGTLFRTDRVGVLPSILRYLLGARKAVRASMKSVTDPSELAIKNGMQLAFKVVANSVYGFTGTESGILPCKAIASAVTDYGRAMIETTRATVESKYGNVHVVYGDTDSVMCKITPPTDLTTQMERIQYALTLGQEMADVVTATCFRDPIKLEFEKVYCPYLLQRKKRYAGLYWTKASAPDKLDVKGLETVRRDIVPFVSTTLKETLEYIVRHSDVEGAIRYVHTRILQLRTDQVAPSELIASKRLAENYVNPGSQPHVAVVAKMRGRDLASAPKVGDRVPFIITTPASRDKAAQGVSARAEDPMHVLQMRLPVDTDYYMARCLEPPLTRLFSPLLAQPAINARFGRPCGLCIRDHLEPEEFCAPCKTRYRAIVKAVLHDKVRAVLFRGDHMQHKKVPPPVLGTASASANILRFAVRLETCVGCRAPIPPPPPPPPPRPDAPPVFSFDTTHATPAQGLCKACSPRADEIRRRVHADWMDALDLVARTRGVCVACAKSEEAADGCANKDCSIFYTRVHERNKAGEAGDRARRVGCRRVRIEVGIEG